ncbi:hypothetical protein SAMN04488082_104140 [Desulfomicrobium apsheronum]|uniref:Uncharacterized protein n=1 Tax=Desulfomicrobium apsheronum TaxID=52560 RepID=A0A1I3SET3_9BACT|nr:hypothetical protein [Desulfomicrobium apsheronum]MDY0226925.1 hypothetical protein [Desulfomicrobium apsheronum]SFJ57313.1 hypothetical protein SAMN04488082_104140 [Desulfomicrobium apsheronum]
MTTLPFVLLGILIGAWFLSVKIMRITVDALSSPRERMVPRSHVPSDQELRQPLRQAEDWAREHGFDDDIMFDFQIASKDQALFCRTWKNAAEKTYLVLYYGMGKHFVELVTIYDDKTGVTTTNAPDAHTLPAVPGAFIQSFPGNGLTDLLGLHLQGRATLERRTGLTPQERLEDTVDLIARSLQRQATYVMSIPGWQWKGIWWITVRKKKMIGKDVGWQLDQLGVFEPTAESPEILQ